MPACPRCFSAPCAACVSLSRGGGGCAAESVPVSAEAVGMDEGAGDWLPRGRHTSKNCRSSWYADPVPVEWASSPVAWGESPSSMWCCCSRCSHRWLAARESQLLPGGCEVVRACDSAVVSSFAESGAVLAALLVWARASLPRLACGSSVVSTGRGCGTVVSSLMQRLLLERSMPSVCISEAGRNGKLQGRQSFRGRARTCTHVYVCLCVLIGKESARARVV